MKVCVIGDIHGTSKFIDCYTNILHNDKDCEKIIVMGDHFDPYENISVEEMLEKYDIFTEICRKDKRIISLLGNHDLASYIIKGECTNRTEKNPKWHKEISKVLMRNLPNSYLTYVIEDFVFSHAGISKTWLEGTKKFNKNYPNKLSNNQKGWTVDELTELTSFYKGDYSGYGGDKHQGCTWIRIGALSDDAIDYFNQVVGHTRLEKITKFGMNNNNMKLWVVDNGGKNEYLTLDIEETDWTGVETGDLEDALG